MKCDGCTLCCKMINVSWMDSPAGEYCNKCEENKGCSIFENASEYCKDYQCLYSQMDKVSINLRPDKCHVIFEKLNHHIITGLIESGHTMNEDIMNQIGSFNSEGISVLMSVFGNKIPTIIPAKGMTSKEVFNEFKNKRMAL